VRPTRIRLLVTTALLVGVLTWGALRVWDARGSVLPGVPWTAPGALLFLAAVLLFSALSLRARLRAIRERRPGARPVNPLSAARLVVLAKASSVAGAVFVGIYGGYALLLLESLEAGPRRERLVASGLSVLAGILAVAAALFLERVCRVPPVDDEDSGAGPLAPA
jgi:Protein of unknown function (DUF3180)